MFGQRLRIARKRAGLSLRELAARVKGKVTHAAIGKYERGEMLPTPPVLSELAKALNVSPSFFSQPLEARLGEIDFRKEVGTSAQERAQVEALVLEHVERYLIVEEILELDKAAWKPLTPAIRVSSFEGAEDAAIQVRQKWQLGSDPLPDITELLEEHGIKVMLLPLPNSVSGLTCLVERPGKHVVPVIVVNDAHTLERRRFTLCHELAHRLLIVDEVDQEKASHRFASAFLMPAAHLIKRVGATRHGFGYAELMETKLIYRVAAAALLVRLRDLKIITSAVLSSMFQTVGRHWRTSEPEPLLRTLGMEEPRRFKRLCYWAIAENLITIGHAAELLQTGEDLIGQEMRGLVGVELRKPTSSN